MKEEIYYCKNCKREELYPKDSEVFCWCRPRKKIKMEKHKPELQKIMKVELKLNLGYSK